MSRIIGLAPYSLKHDRLSVKHATFIIWFCWMWSIFCIILLVALEYIYTARIIIHCVILKEKFIQTLITTSQYSYTIITVFMSLTVNRGRVPQILRKFSEIDQLFSSKLYRVQFYKNTRLFLTIQFAIMILIIMITFTLLVYDFLGNLGYSILCMVIGQSIRIFFNFTVIMHFVNLVFLLRNKHK
jgi:hypothetical protein